MRFFALEFFLQNEEFVSLAQYDSIFAVESLLNNSQNNYQPSFSYESQHFVLLYDILPPNMLLH